MFTLWRDSPMRATWNYSGAVDQVEVVFHFYWGTPPPDEHQVLPYPERQAAPETEILPNQSWGAQWRVQTEQGWGVWSEVVLSDPP